MNCPRFCNVFLRYYLSPAFQTFCLHTQLASHQAYVYSSAKKFQFFLYIHHPSQLCNMSSLMLLYPSMHGVGASLLLFSISSWLPFGLCYIVFPPPCSSTARSQLSTIICSTRQYSCLSFLFHSCSLPVSYQYYCFMPPLNFTDSFITTIF